MKNPEQFRRLAILLQTLAVRTTFKTITFNANYLEMVNFCTELVEKSYVNSVHIMPHMFTFHGTAAEKKEIEDL